LNYVYAILGILAAVFLVFAIFGQKLVRKVQGLEVDRALADFKLQREGLEARFFDLASTTGKPRGLKWLDCDWLSDVTFARDRTSGYLTAFAGLNVRFEAIEGSEMEEVEAVSMVRDAVAVFHYGRGSWGTGGRVLFNMNPTDAVTRLESQYDPIQVPA